MCKPASEGGQRCVAHTRPALNKATRRYREDPSVGNYNALQFARAAYASTPTGQRDLATELTTAEPGSETALDIEAALRRGAQVRERNKAVAAAMREHRVNAQAASAIIAHAQAADDEVDALVSSPRTRSRYEAAIRDDLTDAQDERLSRDDNFGVRQARARRTRNPEVMLRLAQDGEAVYDVVHNPHATEAVIAQARVTSEGNPARNAILDQIARHPNTSGATLLRIADTPSLRTQIAIARHPNAPTHLLLSQMHHPEPLVREAARTALAQRTEQPAT